MKPHTATKLRRLEDLLRDMGGCAVAFSGGVDSSFLLTVAHDVLGDRCLAVIASSPTFGTEPAAALRFALEGAIPHQVVETKELDLDAFSSNPPDRCYHCKKAIFTRVLEVARERDLPCVADGTHADDADAHRPGMAACRELGVQSPLRDAGLTKDDIRTLSREVYDLPTADLPPMACLATRIPYGSPVTARKIAQVAAVEAFLASESFRTFRVRHHGTIARIEVDPADLDRACQPPLREALIDRCRRAGFTYATLDLGGYRSGSMNEVVGKEEEE